MSVKRNAEISDESERAELLKQQTEDNLSAADNDDSAEYAALAEELPNIGKAIQILDAIRDEKYPDEDVVQLLEHVRRLLDTAQSALDEFRESDIMNEFEYSSEFSNAFGDDDANDDEDEYSCGFGYQNEEGEYED